MAELGAVVQKIRSKNAGPFWLTIDIFCGDTSAYNLVVEGLESRAVADALGVSDNSLKRFDIPSLNVVKFSLPRPTVQGSVQDRDLHGASWAVLLRSLQI